MVVVSCERTEVGCTHPLHELKRGQAFWIFIAVSVFLLFAPCYGMACTVSSASLNLGTYTSGQSSSVDGIGSSVTVNCANAVSYQIGLSNGLYYFGTRRLSSGNGYINYQLYRDSSHVLIWGDNPGVDTASGIGDNTNQVQNVYARVPGLQNPSTGSYSDSITATVYY